MEKFLVSCFLLLLFILPISGNIDTDYITCEYEEVQGGGCPDLGACGDTCKRCYVGVGKVLAACLSKGSGQEEDICRCYFTEGAPCNPGCAKEPPQFSVTSDLKLAKTPQN